VPLPSSLVDQAPQYLEKLWETVHLIKDHQLVFVRFQIEFRIGELFSIGGGLQIEVNRWLGLGDLQGQGRLAHLPGSE